MVVHTAPVDCRGLRVAELSAVHKLTLFDAMAFGNLPARLMPRVTATLSFTVIKELQAQFPGLKLEDVGIDQARAVVPTNFRNAQT